MVKIIKAKIIKYILLIFLVPLSQNVFGQVSCHDVLGLTQSERIQLKWDKHSVQEQYNLILKMLGENAQKDTAKDIFEKDELVLGITLDRASGKSLILTYTMDHRFQRFTLGEVSFMNIARESDAVDKKPLDVHTLRVSEKTLDKLRKDFLDDRPLDEIANLYFPSMIEGQLLAKLRGIKEWIDVADDAQLAPITVDGKGVASVYLSSRWKQVVNMMWKYIPRKILINGIVFGTLGAVRNGVVFAAVYFALPGFVSTQPASNKHHQEMRPAIVQEVQVIGQRELDSLAKDSVTVSVGKNQWILHKGSGRIFLKTRYSTITDGVQYEAQVVMEIAKTNTPDVYQKALELFQKVGQQ